MSAPSSSLQVLRESLRNSGEYDVLKRMLRESLCSETTSRPNASTTAQHNEVDNMIQEYLDFMSYDHSSAVFSLERRNCAGGNGSVQPKITTENEDGVPRIFHLLQPYRETK
eukprot:PhF_6_TR41773/c0_g1_i1/m.63383